MLPFQVEAAEYLCDTYLPRIERALAILPAADLWWRPHADCISVGHILRHLEGNVRQWIVSALGGAPDTRERAREFRPEGDAASSAELFERLRATVQAAGAVLRALPDGALCQPLQIQGFDTHVRSAIVHVVEHFSWHTGQIVWIAKARAGAAHGLAFYDDAALAQARNPPPPTP